MPHRLTPIARRLRREATPAERLLWRALNRRQIEGFKFRRQAPIAGSIVDFVCQEAKLIIELDGATHSTDAELAHDAKRSERLQGAGYSILRLRNAELYENLDGAIETIWLKLAALRPTVGADDS